MFFHENAKFLPKSTQFNTFSSIFPLKTYFSNKISNLTLPISIQITKTMYLWFKNVDLFKIENFIDFA